MATAWNGPDPSEVADADDYELAVEYVANVDITITGIRIWAGAGEVNRANRRGRIWTTGGAQLGIATLPDDLSTGWAVYPLDAPVVRLAGQRFLVSYTTGGNYAALAHGLDSAVISADGAVTAIAAASGTLGSNGGFNPSPNLFPSNASVNAAFYGADVEYTVGIGGNTPPRITQFTAEADGATVTAIVVAADDETLTGATYRYDWGDGTAVTVSSSATAQHTYAESGLYAVLASVTDADGLADHAAAAADVVVPSPDVLGLPVVDIFDRLISHALQLGVFDQVNGHEPKAAPGHGLSASFWLANFRPAGRASGLNTTTMRLEFSVRVSLNMLTEPQDSIDPLVLGGAAALMAAYSEDFTLGGNARDIDLLGQHGAPLSAAAGYMDQDGRKFRVLVVTVPIILNDVFAQEA